MSLVRVLLPILLTLRAAPAAADTLTDLLPPDAKVVFGIRVHNLAISSVAQTFAGQAQAAAAGWLKAVPLDGIDFLRDIDEILIASSGRGQTPPALIVVAGHFDMARLAEGASHYYREVPLLAGNSDNQALVALLDHGTVLLGDANLVRAAIDQRAGKNRIDPALNDRITSLRQRYDIWGLGERTEGFAASAPKAKVLDSIDRFQFGVQLASGLELGAEIHARSPEDAQKLHDVVAMIAAMVKGQSSTSGARFDLQADGGTLKLDVYIPDAELKKAIRSQTAAFLPVSTTAPIAAPIAASEAPETGPNAAPEWLAEAAPATPRAPVAASSTPKPVTPMPAAMKSCVVAEQDTVVFTLPGKKIARP
jgi:hypothetical protein